MADADMSNLTATPTKDATPEDIAVRASGRWQRSGCVCLSTVHSALLTLSLYARTTTNPHKPQELKQTINNTEAERQSVHRRAGASLKGAL